MIVCVIIWLEEYEGRDLYTVLLHTFLAPVMKLITKKQKVSMAGKDPEQNLCVRSTVVDLKESEVKFYFLRPDKRLFTLPSRFKLVLA